MSNTKKIKKKSKKTYTEPTVMRTITTSGNYDPNDRDIPRSVKNYIKMCRQPVPTTKKKKKLKANLVR